MGNFIGFPATSPVTNGRVCSHSRRYFMLDARCLCSADPAPSHN